MVAVYISKQREVVLGDDSGDSATPPPPAPTPADEPTTPVTDDNETRQFESQT